MSWHFSRALAAAYSGANSLDGAPFAPSKSTAIAGASLCGDRTTDTSSLFQYGTTSGVSTGDRGEELLTWYRAAFPAKRARQRLEAETMPVTSGRKCGESWQMSLLDTFSPRTSPEKQSTEQRTTSSRWVIAPRQPSSERPTWVQTTLGNDTGCVHTPTVTANYSAPSMMKWECCRRFAKVFGKPTPTNHEWLMAWPIGWTALKPLAMDKFRQWRRSHGIC